MVRTRWLCLGVIVLAVVWAASGALAQPPAPQPDDREVRARELFGASRYAEALEIYIKLYGETTHPTYLRNIGRCHQNLGEPDKAISSFREYLRQAKNLAPDQRMVVEGYIKEMQELKRKRKAEAGPAAPPIAPPSIAASPGSQAPATPALAAKPEPGPSSSTLLASRPRSEESDSASGRHGVRRSLAYVVGGVGLAALGVGAYYGIKAIDDNRSRDQQCRTAGCPAGMDPLRSQIGNESRISDVVIGAGLVAVGVSTYLFLTSRDIDPGATETTARQIRVRPELGPGGAAALAVETSW